MRSPAFSPHLARPCAPCRVTAVTTAPRQSYTQEEGKRSREERDKVGREVPSVTPPQASSAPRFTLITWLPPSVSASCHVACLLDWGELLLSEKVRIIKDKCPLSPPLCPLPPRDEGDKWGSRSSSSAHVQELNEITSHLNNKEP